MNLSSIVIQTRPEHLESVLEIIKSSSDCEYHIHDLKGRIIVSVADRPFQAFTLNFF